MRLAVAIVVWALFGLACAASALWGMRTHGHSVVRIISYDLVVWIAWAGLSLAIGWLGRKRPLVPFAWSRAALHVGAALMFGFVHHVWWTAALVALEPYDAMGPSLFAIAFHGDLADRLFLEGALYFAVLGVTYAVDYHRQLREREVRAAQLEASLAQARLTALELQLQPHFLFNTLHAIGGLVRQDRGKEAVEMIAGLSDLLRYSLDHAGKHVVPLDQELAITARYLEIQRLRFSDRLEVTIDASADARRMMVPAMMLQPLVENAVRHGIERAVGRGVIELSARAVGNGLELVVFNSGELRAIEGGVGVANTRARLLQLYGAAHTFELRSERGGVAAAVTLSCAS
jgi:hypothetical protein